MRARANGDGELGRRIAHVDGLRAVAVLLVVACHTAKWDPRLGQGPALQALLQGTHGVDLFFVLSGFCLSYPILRSLRLRGRVAFDIAGYMARRVVRILPPYYFAMVVLGLVLYVLPHFGWRVPESFSLAKVGWLDVGKQVIFADRRIEFLNPSFWTLAIEWRWYFLFPLALVLWTRSVRAFIFVLCACIIAAAATSAGGFDLPVLPAFLMGVIAAEIELQKPAIGRLAILLLALALCIAVYSAPNSMLGYFMQVETGWQVAAFCLVLAVGSAPLLRAAFSIRPLAWIGVASYSIYLVHEPLVATIEHNTAMSAFLVGALAVTAGTAFWAVFERPFMATSLKGRLVMFLHPRLSRFMGFVGIAPSVYVGSQSGTAFGAEGPVEPKTVREELIGLSL